MSEHMTDVTAAAIALVAMAMAIICCVINFGVRWFSSSEMKESTKAILSLVYCLLITGVIGYAVAAKSAMTFVLVFALLISPSLISMLVDEFQSDFRPPQQGALYR